MKQDSLALAVFGAALALLAGLLLYMFFFKAPEPASPSGATDFLQQARQKMAEVTGRLQEKPEAERFEKIPQVKAPPARSAANSSLEAGHTWRYAVTVEPPVCRDITLTYRTQRESGRVGVLTDFVHAGGKSNFHLGVFAAGHPSHANTRFPGFFMYPAYFRLPLEQGQKFDGSWGWQPEREGRRKAWYAQVVRAERVTVPAGSFDALVMQLNVAYLEGDEVRARTLEFIWYAPEVSQIVKITRHGRTPDEGSEFISAELAEYR